MIISVYLLVFILGACIISFLKVIAHDYPQISLTRRSHCDRCFRILRWYEIIPIIGYFIVHGKCSSCKNQLDFENPLQEFVGSLFLCITIYQNDWIYLPFFIMLIVLSFSDYFYGYVYPIFYLLSLPTIIMLFPQLHLLPAILIYLSLFLLSKRYSLGLGDIEVMSLIGLLFETNFFLNTVLIACTFCLLQYSLHKKRSFRFIPYLTIATGITYMIFSFKILAKSFPVLTN